MVPLLSAVAICACAVALEALFAGSGIRQRLAGLRVPRFAPPLWGWVVIGAAYYAICCAVLYRLFSLASAVEQRTWALALLGAILFINALWNYFFFRTRNLFHAFVIGIPYSVFAVVLFVILLDLDRQAAWWLLPYLVYLFYANAFGYRIWKLNPAEGGRRAIAVEDVPHVGL
jgi:tryptophan-rich sensory protein